MAAAHSIVVLTPGGGHARRLLPLVAMLATRGLSVHVMTRPDLRTDVERSGGSFVDLFARYPIDAVDAESRPLPSRFVTFAAAYIEPLTREIAALRPALIVYDSFMVAAPLVATRLGVPHVGMRAGHAQVPASAIAAIAGDPGVATSPACAAAVRTLRDDHGMADASPFSYLAGVSPYLNLYPEPEQYLTMDEAAAFAPVAFFGSLDPRLHGDTRARVFARAQGLTNVYVSFGTAIWRYYTKAALEAMTRLSDAVSRMGCQVVMSLGGHGADPEVMHRIGRSRVRVETYVDQWAALRGADLFVTHHGLNSTHEAVFHRVPMLSYPFFGDQPAMAECCRTLGLSLPLAEGTRAPLDSDAIVPRLRSVLAHRDAFAVRLAEAREWELDTIAARDTVIDRMLALRG